MKLYATTIKVKDFRTVEKGLGSNQSLVIEIKAEGLKGIPTRANIYRLSLNIGNDNELQAELLDYSTGKVLDLTKGNKQKDKCSEPYCKELNAVGGKCLEHYQRDL